MIQSPRLVVVCAMIAMMVAMVAVRGFSPSTCRSISVFQNRVDSASYLNKLMRSSLKLCGASSSGGSRTTKGKASKSRPQFKSNQRRRTGGNGGGDDSPRHQIRRARVARSIRDEMTDIIRDMDVNTRVFPPEELMRSTTISEVEVSADLSFAKIFISVSGNSVAKRRVLIWLMENVGQVRHSLAKRLRHFRRIPELTFKLTSTNEAADLVTMLENLNQPDIPAAGERALYLELMAEEDNDQEEDLDFFSVEDFDDEDFDGIEEDLKPDYLDCELE